MPTVLKPVFKIGNTDYTDYIAEEGLKPTINDLDADGSGRNILDGLMYRSRIARKLKWTVTFNRLTASELLSIETAMNSQYVSVTTISPQTGALYTGTYYCSAINEGVQRWDGHNIVYDGVTFNIIER